MNFETSLAIGTVTVKYR